MNKLIRVIGLAPSELSFDLLLDKIRREHVRITEALQRFRSPQKTITKRKKEASDPARLQAEILIFKELEKLGITPEQLETLAKGKQ